MPSAVLPFEIIALIIDIVGENKDTNLLKELALVSHSCLQICNKYLFATVKLCNLSPKKEFIELLENRPDIVQYIRKLTYIMAREFADEEHLLSPILSNFLRTISRLNRLTITGFTSDWNTLDSSLKSAFLHLMHLPTINHIDLSNILNFPMSSLILSVNLHRLDLRFMMPHTEPLVEDGSPGIVQSEMPKIREFHTSDSAMLTRKLLLAKCPDGRPAFNFTDLRRLSMNLDSPDDEQNVRYLLQNATLLEKLHLSVEPDRSLVGLHDFLSSSASTLKDLYLRVYLYHEFFSLPLAGLCEELEAMTGYNVLETLSFEVEVEAWEEEPEAEDIGSIIQKVEKVLIKPGWSALRQVCFDFSVHTIAGEESDKLYKELQILPNEYLSHLPNLESIAFNYSVQPAGYYYTVKHEF